MVYLIFGIVVIMVIVVIIIFGTLIYVSKSLEKSKGEMVSLEHEPVLFAVCYKNNNKSYWAYLTKTQVSKLRTITLDIKATAYIKVFDSGYPDLLYNQHINASPAGILLKLNEDGFFKDNHDELAQAVTYLCGDNKEYISSKRYTLQKIGIFADQTVKES